MTSSLLLGGASLIAVTGAMVGTPFFLKWLSGGDVLFTQVPEGTAKAVMKSGSFNHMLMSLKGYHLNVPGYKWYRDDIPTWEVVKNPIGEECESRSYITRELGAFYVGIPYLRTVYEYHFEWNEMRNQDGVQKLWSRDAQTNFIYITSFPYVMELKKAETKDNLPVDVMYQITVRINNPYKALFDTENWIEVVTGIVNGAVRNFVGGRTFDELRSETDSKANKAKSDDENFTLDAKRLNSRLDGEPEPTEENKWDLGLMGKYGVTIEKLDIQSIDLEKEYVASTLKIFNAEQDAKATMTTAKAAARADIMKSTAEAIGIKRLGRATADSIAARGKVLKDMGDLAPVIAQADALTAAAQGNSNSNIIWANSPLVDLVKGLTK